MERPVQWAHLDLKDTPELQVQEPQVNQVRMALQECPDQSGPKVLKDQPDSLVPLGCQVLVKPESLVFLAAEEHLDLLEPQDRRESLAPLGSQVTQVVQVLSAQPDHKGLEGSRVKAAPQDLKETSAWSELLDPEELRVSREHKDSLVNQVSQVQWVPLEAQATTVLRVLKAPRAIQGPQVSQDLMELPDTKDTQVLQELQENPEILDDQDLWALLEHLDHLVLLDLKDTLDLLGLPDRPV